MMCEKKGDVKEGQNQGKPMDLEQYFEEGADEITFLSITSFSQLSLC